MLIAWEGPSGSGKSTAMAQYAVYHPTTIAIATPRLDRIVDPIVGAMWSSAHDYTALVNAVAMETIDILVDRFLISRWVYKTLQSESGRLSPHWRREMLSSLQSATEHMHGEVWKRVGYEYDYSAPNIIIHMLLPELQALIRQRMSTNKQYPYDAARELDIYTEIYAELLAYPINGIVIV